jgi:PadR family transcriptional regulator, regulatory protein PadR
MHYEDIIKYVLKKTYCAHVEQNYTNRRNKKMINNQPKEIQTKLTKGLLDMIILQFLEQQPMHGYQVITKIRKSFGVYFGPSTIYPLLNLLEKKGYIKSQWNMNAERPRKVYSLTHDGENILKFTEGSLNLICKTLSSENKVRIEASPLQAKSSELLLGIHAR